MARYERWRYAARVNDWRILFTTIPGRRPRLAVAILIAVMMTLVLAQKWVPNIHFAWIPLGLGLVLLFNKIGWLRPIQNDDANSTAPEAPWTPHLPAIAVKIITAIAGVIVCAGLYILYRTMDSEDDILVAILVLAPIVAPVLWLNHANRPR